MAPAPGPRWSRRDREWMRLAIECAKRGLGRTAPNPAVGCVIVDAEGTVIGTGYHPKAGAPHAEVFALGEAGESATGSTAYVTLEPCSHFGRTPPCTDALIAARLKRVVAAGLDPDPRVRGRGIEALRDAGITTDVGLEAAAAAALNEGYLKVKRTGMPFVLLKVAMSLDGKVACANGDSRWVTSAAAREYVHRLRDRYDAVMVGVGTIVADDPALTVRGRAGGGELIPRNPVRVIIDSRGRLPVGARVLKEEGRTVVLVTSCAPRERLAELEAAGAEVRIIEANAGRVNLRAGLLRLAEEGIQAVLSEGGPTLASAMLKCGLVDRALFFIAPKIVGGVDAPGPVGGIGAEWMKDALPTARLRVRRFPPDVAIEADLPAAPFGTVSE